MTDTALTEAHNYTNSNSNTKYGNQVSSAYTSGKRYPAIYAQEKLAVINGTPNGDTGLGLSNQDAYRKNRRNKRSNSNSNKYTTIPNILV